MNARILGLALLLAAHCDTDKPDDSLPHRDSDSPVENSPPDSEPGETGDTTESTADTGPTDADGDGWPAHEDCDDSDPTTYPDAADDLCDGIDHDCDGVIGVAIIDGVEHATIQGALDAIDDEGTVLVCPGTHTESLVVDDVASVTLESYSGSHEDTVLSGEGVQRILEIGTGIAAEVSGLAFVNGVATDGGAIWAEASSLTLQSCHFSDNQAVDGDTLVSAQGGAVYWQGNGIDVVELNIESCAFEGNTADGGGAIAAYWSRLPRKIAISDSAFLDNIASVGGGGGIEVWNAYEDTEVIIDSSVAERNSSAYAGGFLWGGSGKTKNSCSRCATAASPKTPQWARAA